MRYDAAKLRWMVLTAALFFSVVVTRLHAQTFSVLHQFSSNTDGAYPLGSLVLDGDVMYGTGRIAVFKINKNGTGYTVLKNYTNFIEGRILTAGLVLEGNTLYGTAGGGGPDPANGTIFRLNTDGSGFTVLKAFTGKPDGSLPYDKLILSGTTLFGTTLSGGNSNNAGTVFRLNTDGSGYEILKRFADSPDGSSPKGPLVMSGNTLYGVTDDGGSNGCCGGTIYKLNTDGSGYVILKHFAAFGVDGANPNGGLVLDGGVLYGNTARGGSNDVGTVFKINTDGTGYTVLKHFENVLNGSLPVSTLVLQGDTLYGTTAIVAGADNGTVFKIRTNGTGFATLKSFSGFVNPTYETNSDGATPMAAVTVDNNALYGTAYLGGIFGSGTIYKIDLTAPLKILVDDPNFGLQSNVFGFSVTGQSNQTIIIEASTNPIGSDWLPLYTNTLADEPLRFNDAEWTNRAGRFYRVRSP
jgi:uncharacterized repeat protein (TIGR03803 family)